MEETTVNKLRKVHNLHYTTVMRCLKKANVPHRDLHNDLFGTVRMYPLDLATEAMKLATPRIMHTAAKRRAAILDCEKHPMTVVARMHGVHVSTVRRWMGVHV